MRGLCICLTLGLLSLAGCGSQQQTRSDLPTLGDMADGASLRQYRQQQRDRARQDARQKDSRPAEYTSASPDRTGPYRVNVQLMYYPMLEPKLNLWLSDLKQPDLSQTTLEAYKANGFGIGEVDRTSLRLFLANLEEPYRVKLATLPISQFVTPITLAKVDRRSQVVNVVDRFGKSEKQRILTGRYQLLMKLVPPDGVLTDGETPVLDLIPHHEGPRASLVPAAAGDIAERGKAFEMLHIVKPVPKGKAWVIWAPVPKGKQALRTKDPLPLGRAMLHGFFRNRPAQLIALIVPTDPLPKTDAPEPPAAPATEPEAEAAPETPRTDSAEVVERPIATPEIEVVMVEPTPVEPDPVETARSGEAAADPPVADATAEPTMPAEAASIATESVESPAMEVVEIEPEIVEQAEPVEETEPAATEPMPVEVVVVEIDATPLAAPDKADESDAESATETEVIEAEIDAEPAETPTPAEPVATPVETVVVEIEPAPTETPAAPTPAATSASPEPTAPTSRASPTEPLPAAEGIPIDPFSGRFRAGGVRVRSAPASSD